jgi:hypothetical protein
VRGRFSKQPDEIATAYQAYFGAWQIHPEQQVPFLMDGQMFGAGNAALGPIGNKLKDKDRPPASNEKSSKAAPPPRGDAFWSALSDMHPRSLGRRETIQRLTAQKDGLALALRQAQAAAVLLPEYGRFFCATT